MLSKHPALQEKLAGVDCQKLDRHYDLLADWNTKINLVSRASFQNTPIAHYLDSIHLCQFTHEHQSVLSLLDIGSGAGFPGLIYAILYPDKKITLFEKLEKKRKFLEVVKEELALENVRIESVYVSNVRPAFLLSRATIHRDNFFSFFGKSASRKSRVLFARGGNPPALEVPKNFSLIAETTYELPEGFGSRSALIYERN